MIKHILTFIFFISTSFYSTAQHFYVKPYVRYHQAISHQVSPEYFSVYIPLPPYANSGPLYVASEIKKFSLANGIKYGSSLGYQLNDVLGIETKIDYFQTHQNINADNNLTQLFGMTDWKYYALKASPVVTFTKKNAKTSITGKVGMVIGIAELKKSISREYFKTYQFNKNITLGYTMGMEYQIHINSLLSLVIEAGIEQSSYTPKVANLKAIYRPEILANQQENVKKIIYVNQVKNLAVNPRSLYSNDYMVASNQPDQRIKEAIQLTSAYLGIGFKYNFIKK